MKKIFTLISLLSIHYSHSQTDSSLTRPDPGKNFRIVIESLPGTIGELTDLYLDYEARGAYSFILAAGLRVPDDHTVVLKDAKTGNSFDLLSAEKHSLSVNRAMTKRFTLCLSKCS